MKQIHKSRSVPRSACILILLVSLCWCTAATPAQIAQTIQLPTINTQRIPMVTQSEQNKTATIGFPDVNFEISSAFYTHNGSLTANQVYNKEMYTNDVSQYCQLYKTSILTQTKARLKYEDGVEPLRHTVYHQGDAKGSNFYLLGSDSNLYVYGFGKEAIKNKAKYKVEYNVGRVRDGELEDNVELFVVGNRLFIANNDSLWVFNQNDSNSVYFTPVSGFERMARLVGVGLATKPWAGEQFHNSTIWVSSDKRILIFTFSVSGEIISVNNTYQYSEIPQTISAITYNADTQHFYLTAARSLYIFKLGNTNPLAQFEINGICTHINLIKTTLYLGCEYEKISFVTELRIQNNIQLVLNRYYDDDFLEGIRDVEYLGNDKVALIGDEQAIIIGEAVNRNVLLDLADVGASQNYEYAYSFSLNDLYYIPHYSTPQHSTIFVIGDSSISVHKITYEPPQIQCDFRNHNVSSVNILVKFNTSHCPFLVDAQYLLNGTYTICETSFPYKIEFAKREYEEKTAKFIFFVIMLMGVAGILLCAGFGMKIRNRANALIEAMRNKIDKVRKEHENSEMKKL